MIKLNKVGFSHFEAFIVLFVMLIISFIGYRVLNHTGAEQIDRTTIVAPTNLNASSITNSSINLTWYMSPSKYDKVDKYNVYRDGLLIGSTNHLTFNYLDTNLYKGTTYSYYVKAVNSLREVSSTTIALTTTNLNSIPLTSCGTYTTPGNYILSADFTIPTKDPSGNYYNLSNPCFLFKNSHNINVNCGSHTINANGYKLAFMLDNMSNSLYINCKFVDNTPGTYSYPFDLVSGNNITVMNNTFGNSYSLANNTRLIVSAYNYHDPNNPNANNTNSYIENNTFYNGGFDTASGLTNDTINNNKITYCSLSDNCGQGIYIAGLNNIVAYNSVEGNVKNFIGLKGLDDGIIIGLDGIVTSNNYVEYNNLNDLYDSGIEFWGDNYNNVVSHNTINTSYIAGISNYNNNNISGNVINANIVTNSNNIFDFYLDRVSPPPGLTSVSFKDNQFTNNTYTPGIYGTKATSYVYIDYSEIPSSILSDSNNVFSGNNIFPVNNFPDVVYSPTNIIVDGGGNNWCPIPPLAMSAGCSSVITSQNIQPSKVNQTTTINSPVNSEHNNIKALR